MSSPDIWNATAHNLLERAGQKLIELRTDADWQQELPARCPPILWFGNALAEKPLIVTFGANPSRKEYLSDSSAIALQKMTRGSGERMLSYLEPPSNRFYLPGRDESLQDIVTSPTMRNRIINGYNNYFERKPYKWFGLRHNPYNVEAFLRGLGASYFDQRPETYQAVHIDLFPFATLSDFKALQQRVETDLLHSGWAPELVKSLLDLLQPKAIVVFGRTNVELFARYIHYPTQEFPWQTFEAGSFCHGMFDQNEVPIVGLSTSLGNPVGFDPDGLRRFGRRVATALQWEQPSGSDDIPSIPSQRQFTTQARIATLAPSGKSMGQTIRMHEIDVPAIIIRLNKSYRPGMTAAALYEATRGVWRVGDRCGGARFAFSVYKGEIVEVYRIHGWQPAGTYKYKLRPDLTGPADFAGRMEFTGDVDDTLHDKYVGRFIDKVDLRGQNPIQYVRC